MSVHRKNLLKAASIAEANEMFHAVLKRHPHLTGKSYRRLVRTYGEKVHQFRSDATRRANLTRKEAARRAEVQLQGWDARYAEAAA